MFGNLKDFFATLQQYIINIKRAYEVIDNDPVPKGDIAAVVGESGNGKSAKGYLGT